MGKLRHYILFEIREVFYKNIHNVYLKFKFFIKKEEIFPLQKVFVDIMVLIFAAFLFIILLTCGRLAINQEEHLTYFENILKIKNKILEM